VAIKIEGVPETISRAQYLKMFTDIGLDPHNCRSLRFGHNSVTAVVFATHPDTGARVMNAGPGGEPGYLTHTVIIHIKDEKEPAK
jgi:hypothetical protein